MDISAFIANEWLHHGDSANPFGGYPVAEYPAPTFAFPIPTYAEPNFCSDFKNLGFEQQQPYRAQVAQLEADLASFMAQYSL